MEEKNFTYKELVEKIKNKEFTNIVFLTGAGMSTSSGIPDFRSPNGVYSKLQKYDLDYPEQVFEINYFTKRPYPFYELHKEFVQAKTHFTSAHYFQAELNRRGQLLYCFSQNIDGLDLEAGLPPEKICQVHGNLRGARCQKCGFKHDIKKFDEFVLKQVVYKCENCKRGLVRPNVVFFGEQLDKGYTKNLYKVAAADCVFIMGTSLKVAPFNMSVDRISKDTPIVIVNRDMVYQNTNKYIHLKNDIDDNIEKLMTDLGWDFPKIERTYPDGFGSKKSSDDSDEEEQKVQDSSEEEDEDDDDDEESSEKKEKVHLQDKKEKNTNLISTNSSSSFSSQSTQLTENKQESVNNPQDSQESKQDKEIVQQLEQLNIKSDSC